MMLPKRAPYRNKAIRDAARGEQCTMNSPACNYDPSTVVFCHSNYGLHGKGSGQKADDVFGFFGCAECHRWYDTGPASKVEKLEAFFYAWSRTLRRLIDMGVLR